MSVSAGRDGEWVLYGSPISLFTRKLEAALGFYGIAFRNERRTEANRAELEARAGTHQIPVLSLPNGWVVADTTVIMLHLDALRPHRRLFPTGAGGVLVHVLEEILDEWVARTMVHYRWHYDENTRAVINELTGQTLSVDEARAHPLATWGLRACRATGTESASQQAACEREYLALLEALEAQLGETRYALGDRPSAVDAALLGGLRGHTLRDPLPDLSRFTRVTRWAATGSDWDGTGEPAPFPVSTSFARHLLGLGAAQYAPFALGNAAAHAAGEKAFTCETWGEPVSYLCRAYPETSRQMVIDRVRHTLDEQDRTEVQRWLGEGGLADCFDPTRR